MTGIQKLARRAGVFIFSLLLLCCTSQPALAGNKSAVRPLSRLFFQQPPLAAKPKTSRIQAELRGDILVQEKQYSDAIAAYQELLRDYPRDAALLNKIGIAYHQELNMREAKRYYERAVHSDPKYASAINNLGALEYQRKNYKKAIRQYDKAIAADPKVSSFYSNLGYARMGLKQFDAASAAFRIAIALDPTLFEQRGQSGTVLMERSVEDRGQFFFYLAKSFAQSGDAERCANYLRKSRDEGYKLVAVAKTDPAFASVRENPLVKEILDSLTPEGARPKSES